MKKYKINKKLVFQKLGKDVLFFNNETSILYTLNETAYLILNKLTSGKSVTEISKKLALNFGVNLNVAKEDVSDIVKTLNKYKIVLSA